MTVRLLRLALLAFPAARRRRDGEILVSTALDLVDGGSSPGREAASLVLSGSAERVAAAVPAGLRGVPWRAALARLALPLAVVCLLVVASGAGHELGAGLRLAWIVTLGSAVVAVTGAASGRRPVALAGAATLALALVAGQLLHRGVIQYAIVADAYVDVDQLLVPVALLLVAATAAPLRARPGAAAVRTVAWALAAATGALLLAASAATDSDGPLLLGLLAALGASVAIASARSALAPDLRAAGALLAPLAVVPVCRLWWNLAGDGLTGGTVVYFALPALLLGWTVVLLRASAAAQRDA